VKSGQNVDFLVINAGNDLGNDVEVCSLQAGDDHLVSFGTSGGLASGADNVADCMLVDSEGRVLGMTDG